MDDSLGTLVADKLGRDVSLFVELGVIALEELGSLDGETRGVKLGVGIGVPDNVHVDDIVELTLAMLVGEEEASLVRLGLELGVVVPVGVTLGLVVAVLETLLLLVLETLDNDVTDSLGQLVADSLALELELTLELGVELELALDVTEKLAALVELCDKLGVGLKLA